MTVTDFEDDPAQPEALTGYDERHLVTYTCAAPSRSPCLCDRDQWRRSEGCACDRADRAANA